MDLWQDIAWLKRGKNRLKIFKTIDRPMMPSEIVEKVYGKQSETCFSVVSRALKELLDRKLVKIKNPKEKTGRIYELSERGKRIKKELS